ncbi:MAG: OmpA family protein [Verrucomicrobiaceae bacterium]|nr:OmpA family protein [Verrucomicrobiaceae bacterium]
MSRVSVVLLVSLSCWGLTSCSTLVDIAIGSPKVIHALSDQGSLPNPLASAPSQILLEVPFPRDQFFVSSAQRTRIEKRAEEWKASGSRLILAGFASADGPPDHARSVSQRRAEAVRTILVDAGLDSGLLHAAGYGSDIPSMSSKDVVRVLVGQ